MNTTSAHMFRNLLGGASAATILAAGFLLSVTPPAHAGVGIGLSVAGGGFSFSLGYSDYPVYSPAWSQPGFALSFDATLSGYGEWITVGNLGRVWRPWVAPGWRPYTWGRWVYTDYGWTWVAYEPWGYVPHHYGSWAMTSFGWVWQPGYIYRPANVAWVSCGSWVGWYPAPPRGWSQWRRGWWNGYRAGRADGYGRGYGHGYADGWRDARYANFVQWNRMTAGNIATVATPGSRLDNLRAGTVHVLPSSPSRLRVQGAVGRPIPTLRVSERTVSMGNRSVRAVRPLGVERAIETHSRETVRRSLAPSIARTMERGGRVTPASRQGSRSPSRAFSSPSPGRLNLSRSGGSLGTQRSTRQAVRSAGASRSWGRSARPSGRSLALESARDPSPTLNLTSTSRYSPTRQSGSRYTPIHGSLRRGRAVEGSPGRTSRSSRTHRFGRSASQRFTRGAVSSRQAAPRRNAVRSIRPGRIGANSQVRTGARSLHGRSISARSRSAAPLILGRSRGSTPPARPTSRRGGSRTRGNAGR